MSLQYSETIALQPETITADPSPAEVGKLYYCNTSGGAFAVTLPSIASTEEGDTIRLVDANNNFSNSAVTLTPAGADTINGVNAAILLGQETSEHTVVRSATEWVYLQSGSQDSVQLAQWADVRVTATSDIAVASALINGATIDGVVVATGDRVLLRKQNNAEENGIYNVAAVGAASRSIDADTVAEFQAGKIVRSLSGTENEGKLYSLSTQGTIVLGTTELAFPLFGAGGLTKQGTVTADPNPAEEGIYGVDASGGAFDFTLPASTGSQERVMVLAEDVATNNVTIKVQTGETLNGTLNGTFICSVDEQMLIATDQKTGGWVLNVVGAGTTTGLDYVSYGCLSQDADVTASVTAVGAGYQVVDMGDPQFDQTLDTNSLVVTADNSVTIKKAGKYEFTFGTNTNINSYDEDILVYVDGIGVVRSNNFDGGSNNREYQTVSVIVDLAVGQRVEFGWDAAPSIAFLNPYFTVKQLASAEVVLAGMVEPTEIGELRIAATADNAGAFAGTATPITFETYGTVIDQGSLATFNGTDLVVTAGTKDVELEALVHTAGSGAHSAAVYFRDTTDTIGIKLGDGVLTNAVSSNGIYGQASQNTPATAVIKAGTTVTLNLVQATSANSQVMQTGSYISVKEVAGTSTVVASDTLVPEELHSASYHLAVGTATLGAADTDLLMDTIDFNVGGIASAGIFTIVNTGKYHITARAGNVTPSNNSQTYIKINGTKVSRARNSQASGGDTDTQTVTHTAQLTAGDTVQMGVYTNGVETTPTSAPDRPTMAIFQLATHTVTTPATVSVDDQASSGYLDIGTMRIQWGITVNSDGLTITLPAAFANTNYVVTGQIERTTGYSGGGGTGVGNDDVIDNKTTTTFDHDRDDDIDGAFYNWIAIGQKP